MAMKATRLIAAVGAVLIATSLAACSGSGQGGSADGKATITFFQSKPEAVDTVNSMIKSFEKANPNITVNQINSPNATADLQARLAKNQVPDAIAVNVGVWSTLVKANVLADQTGTAAAKAVTDKGAIAYDAKAAATDKLLVLPWATNAQVVLYNKDIYSKLGLSVPTTWDQMLSNAKAVQAAGQNPFYFTWKDAWTANVLVNSIGGNLEGSTFQSELAKGKATFAGSAAWKEAASKLLELKQYAQPDAAGKTYNDGNAAFANGQAAMYVQGIWALPVILQSNPNAHIGAFVMPVTNDASKTVMISGTDSVVGVSKASPNKAAAQKFVDYLFSKEGQTTFTDQQHLFPVRSDVKPTDALLSPLKSDWIDKGRTAPYPQVVFSGASNMAAISQTLLSSGDAKAFLTSLDSDYAANGVK